jgi:putative Holliday junction resolvase
MITKNELINKKILAIDYGRKFTGIAHYKVNVDPYILMHGRIAYKDDSQLAQEIHLIVEEDFVDYIVLGIPYFTDGTASTMTRTIMAFEKVLAEKLNIPVYTVDETLTTFEAEERMKNDPRFNFKVDLKQIDALSATIILEVFLKEVEEKSDEIINP